MKKYYISFLLGFAFIIILTYNANTIFTKDQKVSNVSQDEYEKITVVYDTIIPVDSLEDLEKRADLIISGVATGDKLNYVEMHSDSATKYPLYYWTETVIHVSKIHKNETKQEVNESVVVYEPYAVIGKNLYISDKYEITKVGQDYLMFLANDTEEGKFLPVGVYHGMYQFDETDRGSHVRTDDKDKDAFEKLKESVIDRYRSIHTATINPR